MVHTDYYKQAIESINNDKSMQKKLIGREKQLENNNNNRGGENYY